MTNSIKKGHLTFEERNKITILQAKGLSIRKIAKELDKKSKYNIKGAEQKRSRILQGSIYRLTNTF